MKKKNVNNVHSTRKQTDALLQIGRVRASTLTVGFVGKFLTIFSAVLLMAVTGRPVSPAVVFPCLVYYNAINKLFLNQLPCIVRMLADWTVSNKRFQVFIDIDFL